MLSLFHFFIVSLQSNYKDINVLVSLDNMARLISRQEVARLLDVSLQTVSNWIEKGYIKGHMIDKHLMVDRETIEQYFDGLKELAHLEKTVEEKKEYLRKEDFKLGLEINDLLEAREKMEDGPHGVFRTIAKYATMSAYDLFTEQQQTIFYRMMDWGNAEHIGKELGLSRSRVVEIYCNCLRKISDVIDLVQTQERWNKLEAENRRLNVLVASLRQQLTEYKAKTDSAPESIPMPENEQMIKLLSTPLEDLKLTVRAVNVLKGFDCLTLGDVACLKKEDLMNARFCGLKTIEVIENELAAHGLTLGSDLQLLLQVPVK